MTDIREIDGLWCDDITFCQEECGWRDCPRNKENIRDRTVPHSFSVEIPQDCPKRKEGELMTNRENVIEALEHCRQLDFEMKKPTQDAIDDALVLLKDQDERIKLLEHQLETITRWRANAGAFD